LKKYIFLLSFIFISSCAYYNTFFNAKKVYNEAFEKQKTIKEKKIPADVKKNYNSAIKKCWKLIDVYSDSNKYADDALLLIGKSHYNLQEYPKSERVFEQFILKYSQSEFIPEAKLWLAKSYIAVERDDDALQLLNELIEAKISSKIAGQVFYILGDLYFQREIYDQALINLDKTTEIVSDDEILGNAHYLIGETYFQQKKYDKSIQHFGELTNLEIPILKEFEAQMQQVEANLELENYQQAEIILKKMLRDIRFKKQFSLIETKLGNLSEIQEELDFARDTYYDIISKYKNDEGASLSAFYLAQLFEFVYTDFDSAKTYYDKVKKLKNHEEVNEEAKLRSNLLKEYIQIRNQLRKDQSDLYSLARGDSILFDSLEVEPDSSELEVEKVKKETLDLDPFLENLGKPVKQDSVNNLKTEAKKKSNKVAVSRKPEQVGLSYKKNSFARAEFFLLKYQNYDSALVAYDDFIELYPEDSLLTPKSVYTLYFIYQNLLNDSLTADSLKNVIIKEYPESLYGQRLLGIVSSESLPDDDNLEAMRQKENFRQAETHLFTENYEQAISHFKKIAIQDSGSVLAQKSRYAIAYTYEYFIKDIPSAIEAYTILLQEYPGSEFGKIAQNKVKEPPKDISEKKEDTEQKENIEPEEVEHIDIPDEKIIKEEDPQIKEQREE